MNEQMFQTLKMLKLLNEKLGGKSISEKEFIEEHDNIDDFIQEKDRLRIFLEKIEKLDLNNKDLLCENLVDLHLIYTNFIWHFEQMHELILKVIQECPD